MPNKKVLPPQTTLWGRITRYQIIIPLIALLLLVLVNLIADPTFFKITMKPNSNGDNILSGNIISIIDNGSELAILALGMTLVTAASESYQRRRSTLRNDAEPHHSRHPYRLPRFHGLRRFQRRSRGFLKDPAHGSHTDTFHRRTKYRFLDQQRRAADRQG